MDIETLISFLLLFSSLVCCQSLHHNGITVNFNTQDCELGMTFQTVQFISEMKTGFSGKFLLYHIKRQKNPLPLMQLAAADSKKHILKSNSLI